MIHTRALIDIIESVVADISVTVDVLSVTDNGDDTYDLFVLDLKWAEPGRTVTIGAATYTIVSVDGDSNTIVVSGTTALSLSTTSFDLYQIYVFRGSPIAVNNELQEIQEARNKTPMVLLFGKPKERFYTDQELMLERESTCTLCFLTQADFEAWVTNDFDVNAIRPMRRLMDLFFQAIDASYQFDSTDLRYDVIDHSHFGVYVNTKGTINSFFGDKLSGCQVDVVLKINRTDDCEPTLRSGIGYWAIQNNFVIS
jgi:hypothetical protein